MVTWAGTRCRRTLKVLPWPSVGNWTGGKRGREGGRGGRGEVDGVHEKPALTLTTHKGLEVRLGLAVDGRGTDRKEGGGQK